MVAAREKRAWPLRCYLYLLEEMLRVAFGARREIEYSSRRDREYTPGQVRCLPSRPTATGCDIICKYLKDARGHDLYMHETAMDAEGSLGAF